MINIDLKNLLAQGFKIVSENYPVLVEKDGKVYQVEIKQVTTVDGNIHITNKGE